MRFVHTGVKHARYLSIFRICTAIPENLHPGMQEGTIERISSIVYCIFGEFSFSWELLLIMPKSCSYGLCKNNSRTSKCRFFVFPSIVLQPDRRRLWAIRCDRRTYDGRTWEPNPDSKYVYVCEYHFVTGKNSNIVIKKN